MADVQLPVVDDRSSLLGLPVPNATYHWLITMGILHQQSNSS